MARKLTLLGVILLSSFGWVNAQADTDCVGVDPETWNFHEGEAIFDEARVKNAYYTDQFKSDNYENAAPALFWLLQNVPDLNPSLYINGAKIYQALGDAAQDPDQQTVYYDSMLTVYDQRIHYYCDPDGKILERKAYLAFRYFYKNADRHMDMYTMFKKARALRGDEFLPSNLEFYLQVSAWLTKMKKISEDDFLLVYEDLTGLLSHHREEAVLSADQADKLQKKMDGILLNLFEVNDAFIESRFCDAFTKNPNDLMLAKRILSFSIAGKATRHSCMLPAAKTVMAVEPTGTLARFVGDKLMLDEAWEDAITYYEKALELTEGNVQRSEIYYAMSLAERKRGRFAASRAFSRKGLEQDPTNKQHYMMIGDVYQAAYEGCRQGENIVHDRAVFIAAYNMYKLAGDAERMAIAKQQFPSKEEVFNYNMEVGTTFTIPCWVGETVTLQTRD